jgi:hypothetical protein
MFTYAHQVEAVMVLADLVLVAAAANSACHPRYFSEPLRLLQYQCFSSFRGTVPRLTTVCSLSASSPWFVHGRCYEK